MRYYSNRDSIPEKCSLRFTERTGSCRSAAGLSGASGTKPDVSSSHQTYLQRRHFAGLDGVRAVAIIAVVWHHTVHPTFLPIFVRGFVGVDLFFVLSGFLISTLLIREKAKTGRISLKDFWMRRILRLVPAYYLLLFGLLGAYVIFKPGDPDTKALVDGFPIYALYLSNWFEPGANNLSITWSLATEEQFYLIWPLVESFAAPIVMLVVWAAALIVNQLINFGLLDPAIASVFDLDAADHPEILQSTFTPILLGVSIAHLLHRQKTHLIAEKIAGFRGAPIVFAALLLLLLNIPATDISGAIRLSFHLVMALWIASIVLRPSDGLTKLLDWRPIAFVGGVSYGMYLYHMWCIHIAKLINAKLGLPQQFWEFPLALAGTIILSAISFYLFEKRFLALRRKFRP